jgi:hypothetical protein
MRKLLIVFFLAMTLSSFSQRKNLYQIWTIKPKMEQKGKFEDAWKGHITKFHQGKDRRVVYEIISGPDAGSYQIVNGPFAAADLSKVMAVNPEHDSDYAQLTVDIQSEGAKVLYVMNDSLSYHTNVDAYKYLINVIRLKPGHVRPFVHELKKAADIYPKMKAPFSVANYVQVDTSVAPTVWVINALKKGWKEMESSYHPEGQRALRATYVSEYSKDQWDERLAVITDAIDSRISYEMKYRKDLSSEALDKRTE